MHVSRRGQVNWMLVTPCADRQTTRTSPIPLMRTWAIKYKCGGGSWGHIFRLLHVGRRMMMVVVGDNCGVLPCARNCSQCFGVLTHLSLTTTLYGEHHRYSHSINKGTEAKCGYVAFPGHTGSKRHYRDHHPDSPI